MPQFDYNLKTAQGQVNAPRIRDQGQSIRAQTSANVVQGVQQIFGTLAAGEERRTQEKADSDMSAFQAERIRREQAFRESSASITNDDDYKKAVDKYVTDLNKYAAGKRPDGTKVFRNNMGTESYKQFNQQYSAKFKAAGSEHAFQLGRKRDKLNYRIAINSGIKNNTPRAITDSYDQLEETGHISHEERIIEQERDLKAMALNHFAETQATMMLGVDEALKQTTDLKQTSETIKGAFENYKNEVYSNKNLNDQERKGLIDNAKASLKALDYKNRAQASQAKHQGEVNTNMAVHEWQTAILNGEDPEEASQDPEEASRQSFSKWGTKIDPKARTKFFDRAMKHSDQKAKAAKDSKQAGVNKSLDLSLMHKIRSYDPANDPTGKEWVALNEDAAFMFNSTLKSSGLSQLKELNPTDPNSKSPFGEFNRASNKLLGDLMGIGLTQTARKALGSRIKVPTSLAGSPEEFFDYLSESERLRFLNEIMTEASELYKKDPSQAKEFINNAKDKLHKENNDRIFYDQYFKVNAKDKLHKENNDRIFYDQYFKVNPYDMTKRK